MTADSDSQRHNSSDPCPNPGDHAAGGSSTYSETGRGQSEARRRATPVTSLDAPRRTNIIDKVRAMLAKAASTTHEPEREAFEAKAQALITRYQIAANELQQADSEIIERRIDIRTWGDATRGVIYLYGGIAELNRSSAAHRSIGEHSQVILFGTDVDLDLTETVARHLLPQLRTHMLLDRPNSRMSYAIGWTHEVLSRLIAAQQATMAEYGAIVPTNTAADEAMLNAYKLKSDSQTTMVDSVEYEFGASAACRADIGRTKLAAG
ncbi:MAG: DUF2786 domain-containing protein [Acidimicrobiia bacterium]|nr:DUF2786 domain-containing protein [Acidimicrobiia bacterium]